MILDCCAQQRTYEKFFGLMAQRFCQINKTYVMPFQVGGGEESLLALQCFPDIVKMFFLHLFFN